MGFTFIGSELALNATLEEACSAHPFEMFCHFPATFPLYSKYEVATSGYAVAESFMSNLWIGFCISATYLIACALGVRYMRSRKPFVLATPLIVWNLALSMFSLVAFLRTAPQLLFQLYHHDIRFTVCEVASHWFGDGTPAFWVGAFVLSKIPELFDTAFIIARKKPLTFLHWYHHSITLLVCWYAAATSQSAGLWFIAMNFGVHTVMYFYYFLSALGRRVAWAPLVTFLQIAQMFVGSYICIQIELAKRANVPCAVTPMCHFTTSLMYASYLVLFCHFNTFAHATAPYSDFFSTLSS